MNQQKPAQTPVPPSPGNGPSPAKHGAWIYFGGFVLLIAALWGLRHFRARSPAKDAGRIQVAAVATVARRDLYKELSIQAEFRPYLEVELYAKVAGYLKSINVDFGDRVKAGEIIATIEVPELQNELDHAVAAEQRADADYQNARLDYTRLADVNKSQPNLVAQQDLDAAEARDLSAKAAVAAAKADRERYQTLVGYTRIVAPFDGVVTARYADPGAMIQTASSSQTQSRPLIRLSENQRLRLDFPVSVSYADEIAVGDPIDIDLEGSGRHLPAKITRSTRQISMATRTMETEVEVPNPDLKLIPGMYATVVLHLQRRPNALAIPVEAVNATGSPVVYRVNRSGEVEECPVKLGIEGPEYYEVLSGLSEGDQVVVGSRAGLETGQKVLPKAELSDATP
ncbi:MAG TPA: efflux RND transporter periplasmic adaptor subunit [Opitutaceae bacterium]|jgi:RND family efflux transporter MFP subunit